MEQYEIHPKRFWKELQKALMRFEPSFIFIRRIGSQGGETKVREDLLGKRLQITKPNLDLHIAVDGAERFVFEAIRSPASECTGLLKWAIAYERWYAPTPAYPRGKMHFAGTGYPNPDDPSLPSITSTTLRCANEAHFIEITFQGKIPITRTHRPTKKRYWAYWGIVTPEKKKEKKPPRKT